VHHAHEHECCFIHLQALKAAEASYEGLLLQSEAQARAVELAQKGAQQLEDALAQVGTRQRGRYGLGAACAVSA